jgi:hypothetical protein
MAYSAYLFIPPRFFGNLRGLLAKLESRFPVISPESGFFLFIASCKPILQPRRKQDAEAEVWEALLKTVLKVASAFFTPFRKGGEQTSVYSFFNVEQGIPDNKLELSKRG